MISELAPLIKPIEPELNLFERTLQKTVLGQDNFLKKDLEIFIFSCPKRLRVIFVFLFSKILKINSDCVLKIALIVELLHNASLIHDDIIDEEKTRRGNQTFYNKFDSKLAVLEGDLLLSMALELLSETNLDILKIFSSRIKSTINGEINQGENTDRIVSEKEYLQKTLDKTGNLFLAGLESLFVLGGFEETLKNNLFDFMTNYSIAFQIKNDIDNIKTTKSDIKNGNYTLPVLYFFMENIQILQTIKACRDMDFSKYINKAEQKFDEFKNKAINSLENIPASIYKNSLLNICELTLRS